MVTFEVGTEISKPSKKTAGQNGTLAALVEKQALGTPATGLICTSVTAWANEPASRKQNSLSGALRIFRAFPSVINCGGEGQPRAATPAGPLHRWKHYSAPFFWKSDVKSRYLDVNERWSQRVYPFRQGENCSAGELNMSEKSHSAVRRPPRGVRFSLFRFPLRVQSRKIGVNAHSGGAGDRAPGKD